MAKPERIDGFIAVRMPGGVRSRLESVSDALRGAGVTGEWQQAGTHHLTLKYVGEIGDDEFDAIAEALRGPCAALSLPEFTVGPLFTFDNQEGQTILAARVEPKGDLQRLVRVIERVAAGCGAPESDFPSFKPHVTLCYMDEDGAEAWRLAKPDLDIPESFGALDIASVPLSESVGDGQDFRIRRLVKVGWSSCYHRASRLVGGAARAKKKNAPAKAKAPAKVSAPACIGCGGDSSAGDETPDGPYCEDCRRMNAIANEEETLDDSRAGDAPPHCEKCGAELDKDDQGSVEALPGEWYCEDCAPGRCSACGEQMTPGEEQECEGDALCGSCFDSLCASCAKCYETGYAEDMVHALGEHFDPECAPPQCSDCGLVAVQLVPDLRYVGGLERAMDRFTSAYRQRDVKMAERIWDAFDLTAWMFRRRGDFADAAFWAYHPGEDSAEEAVKLRLFLSPGGASRDRFLDVLDVIRPDMCSLEPEMPHDNSNQPIDNSRQPIALLAREDFLPRALKLLSKDRKLAESLRKPPDSASFNLRQNLERWGKFFESYARRQRAEKTAAVSAALAAGFLRLALSPADFYDFYALSLNESTFPSAR
jgi:2'-5' RNA ligase